MTLADRQRYSVHSASILLLVYMLGSACSWHKVVAAMQLVLFVNDTTISKGMVKYASNLTRESIIDVEGTISVPQVPVVACSQSEVSIYAQIAEGVPHP